MVALLSFIKYVLQLYVYVIIAGVILSWLIAFNVINTHNNFVRNLAYALNQVTEPALGPIRRFMPDLGGIDISPVILILIIIFLQSVVIGTCGSGFLMPLVCTP